MNKAFVREPEDTGQHACPRCGSLGVSVQQETLQSQLGAEGARQLSATGYFCPFPKCEVAYFDQFDRIVTVECLQRPVYPKSPDAPICACFGLTTEDIEADLREGKPTRVRALLEQAKSPEAHCLTAAASGQNCIGAVQRYYMQRLNQRSE